MKQKFVSDLDSFQFLSVLGDGPSGIVYKALSKKTGKIVSIKMLYTEISLLSKNFIEEIPTIIQIFHSNIIKYHELISKNDRFYIVMEYCPCGSLEDIVSTSSYQFKEDEIWFLLQGIIRALLHLQNNGRIHTNLKLSNILVDSIGNSKVCDYLMPYEKNSILSNSSNEFLPPENKFSLKSSVWQIGIIILKLIRAKFSPPSNQDSLNINPTTFTSPSINVSCIPLSYSLQLISLTKKCLQINPDLRPSLSELLDDGYFKGKKLRIRQLDMAFELSELMEKLRLNEPQEKTSFQKTVLSEKDSLQCDSLNTIILREEMVSGDDEEEDWKNGTMIVYSDDDNDSDFTKYMFFQRVREKAQKVIEKPQKNGASSFIKPTNNALNRPPDLIQKNSNKFSSESEKIEFSPSSGSWKSLKNLSVCSLQKLILSVEQERNIELAKIQEKYNKKLKILNNLLNLRSTDSNNLSKKTASPKVIPHKIEKKDTTYSKKLDFNYDEDLSNTSMIQHDISGFEKENNNSWTISLYAK